MGAANNAMADIVRLVYRVPVLAQVHPPVPLALEPAIQLVTDAQALAGDLDDRLSVLPSAPLLILGESPLLQLRFPFVRAIDAPDAEAVNRHLPHRIGYARDHLLTNHRVADWIEDDVARDLARDEGCQSPDIVAVLLVDGLSYDDARDWRWSHLEPCFIDGPSVTYRFHRECGTGLNPHVGFAAVIGRPSIQQRLYSLGFRTARGYTYWSPGGNEIADFMFEGVPFQRAANFEAVLAGLERERLPSGSYVQVVRQGLDGLAHGKRELQAQEIQAARDAIRQDIWRLLATLSQGNKKACLYVTADHGVLWKLEHEWQVDSRFRADHPRYFEDALVGLFRERTTAMDCGGERYTLCHYPWLAGPIPIDDSGVHGGLSYQESFVPMGKLRG